MVQHFAGSQHFQLTHVEMLEQANHVEWLKGEVRNAETSSKARLEEFMHYSGCSGKSALFELEYFDMSRTEKARALGPSVFAWNVEDRLLARCSRVIGACLCC